MVQFTKKGFLLIYFVCLFVDLMLYSLIQLDCSYGGRFCWFKRVLRMKCLAQSKKEGKDQESIQSSTTPDPGYQWECDNVKNTHHKREPRGQPIPSR